MVYRGFCGPAYTAQAPLGDGEECINFYPEHLEVPNAPVQWVLNPTPGFQTFTTGTSAPGRALFSYKSQAWAITGAALDEIAADGTVTNRGTLVADQFPATMTTNGDGGGELFITSGNQGDLLTLATNVLTSAVVSDVTMGGMLDGYFLALDAATSTFKISDQFDGTTWDPTQFLQRSTQPDPWVALTVVGSVIYLPGSFTTDVLYNNGAFPFPFAPFPGGTIPYGTPAPWSCCGVGDTLMMLAQSASGGRFIVQISGSTATVVSTKAVQYAIERYVSVSDAEAFSYAADGHVFYVLNFPSANATWTYDVTEGLWHKRLTWDETTGTYHVGRARGHCYAFDRHLVGDRTSGTIATMASTYGSEIDGGPIRRLRRPPGLQTNGEWVTIAEVQIDAQPGLGLVSGQGSNPEMLLRTSWDGGMTFGGFRSRSAGEIGQYATRLIWMRGGAGRRPVHELVVTDPIPWRISNGYLLLRKRAS